MFRRSVQSLINWICSLSFRKRVLGRCLNSGSVWRFHSAASYQNLNTQCYLPQRTRVKLRTKWIISFSPRPVVKIVELYQVALWFDSQSFFCRQWVHMPKRTLVLEECEMKCWCKISAKSHFLHFMYLLQLSVWEQETNAISDCIENVAK